MENWCEYVSQEGEIKNVLQVSGCASLKVQLVCLLLLTPQNRSSRKITDFNVEIPPRLALSERKNARTQKCSCLSPPLLLHVSLRRIACCVLVMARGRRKRNIR